MLSVDYTLKGIMAFATRGGRSTRQKAINRYWSAAIREALSLYATGRLPKASILDRFKPGADGVYGFTDRTAEYDARKMRALGRDMPYYSPRGRKGSLLQLANLAAGAANGKKISARALVSALQRGSSSNNGRPHMRDLVRIPGAGHVIQTRGTSKITTTIKWPGARILNRLADRAPQYRREFSDLRMGGGRDLVSILKYAEQKYKRDFAAFVRAQPARKSRSAA
jgi:hypothetical protein